SRLLFFFSFLLFLGGGCPPYHNAAATPAAGRTCGLAQLLGEAGGQGAVGKPGTRPRPLPDAEYSVNTTIIFMNSSIHRPPRKTFLFPAYFAWPLGSRPYLFSPPRVA
ncbi:hypothetical protein F4775DRAFT_542418, partial [Biscogniauxia sp. FL1348]